MRKVVVAQDPSQNKITGFLVKKKVDLSPALKTQIWINKIEHWICKEQLNYCLKVLPIPDDTKSSSQIWSKWIKKKLFSSRRMTAFQFTKYSRSSRFPKLLHYMRETYKRIGWRLQYRQVAAYLIAQLSNDKVKESDLKNLVETKIVDDEMTKHAANIYKDMISSASDLADACKDTKEAGEQQIDRILELICVWTVDYLDTPVFFRNVKINTDLNIVYEINN